jgi:hypothetical protein
MRLKIVCVSLGLALLGACAPVYFMNKDGSIGGSTDSGTTAPVDDLATERAPTEPASDDFYEDWWICANECDVDDSACVDKCTDEFNDTHAAAGSKVELIPLGLVGSACGSDRAEAETGDVYGVTCPSGSQLSPFAMPIYDDDGLFVVGYETVWFCLDDDLQPAG